MPEGERPRPNQKYDWQRIAEELRAEPGEWALIGTDVARAHAVAIRAGRKKWFQPPEDWLVMTKGPRGSRAYLYIAFIGAPGARLRAMRNVYF